MCQRNVDKFISHTPEVNSKVDISYDLNRNDLMLSSSLSSPSYQ